MHARTKTLAAAISITALAVVGLDTYTYAGTGDSLILGKLNKSSKTTHITNTGKGPALSLHALGNRPALAVDSKAKIVKLNADRIDGRNASWLQNNVRVFTANSGSSSDAGWIEFELPDFPNGRYLATYNLDMNNDSTGAAEEAFCYFYEMDGEDVVNFAWGRSFGYQLAVSATDVIKKDDSAVRLFCGASAPWAIYSYAPVRVTLTRIDKTIGGSLDASRVIPNTRTPTGASR